MIRAAAAGIAVVGALVLGVASARAADECNGLLVCIPVAGPWVAIPAAAGGSTAAWQLTCPEGVVGGVDARASEAAVAVEFPGLLGSPVNPGITTSRSLVFEGTYAGRAGRVTTYRPFIGCIPGGGGGPRTPTASSATVPVRPGTPITIRVKTLRLVPGTLARTTFACRQGERLLRAGTSVGIHTERVPSAGELAAVRVVRAVRGGTVLVSATRRGLAPGVRASVQIHAECAR